MPQITLCPPGACPPDSTTPTLSGMVGAGSADGTSDAEGWPNTKGNSLAISSAPDRKPRNLSSSHEIQRERCGGEAGSLTRVASGRAGWPVGDREVGAEDRGEGQRVQEPARLHLAVHGGKPPGRRPVRGAVGRHCRCRHVFRPSLRFGSGERGFGLWGRICCARF
jgi:hypothetical protein